MHDLICVTTYANISAHEHEHDHENMSQRDHINSAVAISLRDKSATNKIMFPVGKAAYSMRETLLAIIISGINAVNDLFMFLWI